MKKIILIYFLFPLLGIAQQVTDQQYYLVSNLNLEEFTTADRKLLDSCLTDYHAAVHDTDKINALNGICDLMVHDAWSKYQFYQYKLTEQAIENHSDLAEKRSLQLSLEVSLNNIGLFYERQQGNISKALTYYHKSLKINEELDNKKGIAIMLNRIGVIHMNQGGGKRALEFFQKSIKLFGKIGNKKDMANPLNNIGLYYERKGEVRKALSYFLKSLSIDAAENNEQGVSVSLGNIGRVYVNQKKYLKALDFFQQSLQGYEKRGDQQGISSALSSMGSTYLKLNNLDSAYATGSRSMIIAKKIGYPSNISTTAGLLSSVYEQQDKRGEALGMYKLYVQMKDSVYSENTKLDAVRQQSKYEYEKQRAIDDAMHDNLMSIKQEEKEKQQIIIYAIAGGLSLLGIFLIFVVNRLQVTRKQKTQIENQKMVLEEAHEELSQKNREILDSINYAKRIQKAILPRDNLVKEHLPSSYIIYKPKDIVAGDFYWLEAIPIIEKKKKVDEPAASIYEIAFAESLPLQNSNNTILFAAADCTGHGVPGAMVSVVCNNGLNRAVREYAITDPGKILDKTREIVIQEFEKSEENVRDGMDIALCSLEGTKLKYAGALNPLWIIRKKTTGENKKSKGAETKIFRIDNLDVELYEVKANKQPIGRFRDPKPYTTHEFELDKGDTVFIFSDGYIDQFGGEKGKKFKAQPLRELLLSIHDKPMEEQRTIIDDNFESWKGDIEQVDDVCVIGVRV